MESKIYLRRLPSYQNLTAAQEKYVGINVFYNLAPIPSEKMKEEFRDYILYRSEKVAITTLLGERKHFKVLCRFLQKRAVRINSLRDLDKETWVHRLKQWMMLEGIPLTYEFVGTYGNRSYAQAEVISYLENILNFTEPEDNRPEVEKNVWELKKLDIQVKASPIKRCETLIFTKILQPEIREEVKKGIYLNLQDESLACIQKELTAIRRLSAYLQDKHPDIKSCQEIDRELLEDYLTYLKTEEITTKHLHSDLTRLRAILESIGKIYNYSNLEFLFLTRDIPPTPKSEFRSYSESELRRLNAALVDMDEQIARLMIIHQMLGTRISDTLTLEPDCLYEKNGTTIIRIRQVKSNTYEKPISAELSTLIRKAIEYTKEHYGDTPYIFVDERNPTRPMSYGTLQIRVVTMIRKADLRDDNGELFGFGTHMYRHTYGVKLTELHLDDWTIAKLLGHSNVRNVKYYRKMSNQLLADETRRIRNLQSQIILENLDGWEEEYAKIREDDRLEPADQ